MPFYTPKDNDIIQFGQLKGVIRTSPQMTGTEPLLKYRTKEGSMTSTHFYFGNQFDALCKSIDTYRADKPNRSMVGFEFDPARLQWDRVKRRLEFGVMVLPGVPLSEYRYGYSRGIFTKWNIPQSHVMAQLNTSDRTTKAGFSPPFEIGLRQVGDQLNITMGCHKPDPTGSAQWTRVQGPVVPIPRNVSIRVAAEVLDLHGEPGGSAKVWIQNGPTMQLVWDIQDNIGHINHGPAWSSFGSYRNNSPEDLFLRITDFQEGPVGNTLKTW